MNIQADQHLPKPGIYGKKILIQKKILTMKKLTGMKKGFSSLENKKLKRDDLKSVNGSLRSYAIESSAAVTTPGCYEADHYTSNGGDYIGRLEVC
ncbi:TIGR04139 family peptide modification target [Chryseobacterium nakagawai]|nr:TIGR04139 family peptide modification target [Chryseobacterium nakagawai]